MDRSILQLTHRELLVFFRSVRFWATFGAVVSLFALTGPFGTFERMHWVARFGFWLFIHLVTWGLALLCVTLADILLARRIGSLMLRMLVGGSVASVPIGLAVSRVNASVFDEPMTIYAVLLDIAYALPLTLVFCGLTWMTMNRQTATSVASAPPDAHDTVERAGPPPLLSRLKPEGRGALLRLSAEDHYTLVETSRGRSLVLMRFADALGELGDTEGLQVHRSHWVARCHVAGIRRDNGKLHLALNDGGQIPVSRSYADRVRRAFE